MGAGKSSLLRRLTVDAASYVSLDFDQEIFVRHALKQYRHLSDLIEDCGWTSFRSWERALLLETLQTREEGIFALGGGTLEEGGVDLILADKRARLVWLNTPVAECWQRVQGERPLAKDWEQFHSLYLARLPNYRKAHIYLK